MRNFGIGLLLIAGVFLSCDSNQSRENTDEINSDTTEKRIQEEDSLVISIDRSVDDLEKEVERTEREVEELLEEIE